MFGAVLFHFPIQLIMLWQGNRKGSLIAPNARYSFCRPEIEGCVCYIGKCAQARFSPTKAQSAARAQVSIGSVGTVHPKLHGTYLRPASHPNFEFRHAACQ